MKSKSSKSKPSPRKERQGKGKGEGANSGGLRLHQRLAREGTVAIPGVPSAPR